MDEFTHERAASLRLLHDFAVVRGGARVVVRRESERLLAFLAIAREPVRRARLAGALWSDVTDRCAAASLRSALWRLGDARDLVVTNRASIGLAPTLTIDLHEATAAANAHLSGAPVSGDLSIIDVLTSDLLPGWYEEWAVVEAERWRHLRARALDVIARRLLDDDRAEDALCAALSAVRVEPMHERAHRTVIEAELTLGNLARAHAHYEQYRALLWAELGVEPGERVRSLLYTPKETVTAR